MSRRVGRVAPVRGGFSLIELLVVLGVTALLAALLFPAFRSVRETAQRLACASNMRQIGLALTMYGDQNHTALPLSLYSTYDSTNGTSPRGLAFATTAEDLQKFPMWPERSGWTGLGTLLGIGGGGYLDSPQVLYSPSYRGTHTFERYRANFVHFDGMARIVTNYHYCGHVTFTGNQRRTVTGNHHDVLLTTALRTVEDLNQRNGTNVLRADGAVTWFGDPKGLLPEAVRRIQLSEPSQHPLQYESLWKTISGATE